MRIRATTKLQNDKMIAAREKLGLNQTKAAAAAGISLQAWIHLEKLRYSRYTPTTLEQHATTISLYLDIPTEEIAPRELWGSEVPSKHVSVREVDTKHLLEAVTNHEQHYLLPEPVTELEQAETREAIDDILGSLTSQEKEIIQLRFGLTDGCSYNEAEIARIFKMSHTRINQVVAKALRKLGHPTRMNKLASVI